MLIHILLVAHIIVLGYWLGAEFVINSTYRYVSYHGEIPFSHRDRLMSHVLDVDQHVRYALVLQVGLGATLAALLGYIPGGDLAAIAAAVVGLVWLLFVETVHRFRSHPAGKRLASIDRGLRYLLIITLVAVWATAIFGSSQLRPWLAWKLLMFAGVLLCGVGIRVQIMRFFQIWKATGDQGLSDESQQQVEDIYVRATAILVGLWVFIGAVVFLSIGKAG
jgi:hypothetical protein